MRDDDDLDQLSGGWRRGLSTVRLAGALGRKAAGRMLRGRGHTAADDATAVARAQKLVDRLGQMKGLVMKAGQIASYMPGALPPGARDVLAQLQTSSTRMAWPAIEPVLRAELGEAPFDAIDEAPFAAASIGQVHRAMFRGAPVAVKVQYPGVEDAIASDLKMVAVIARLSSVGSPIDGAGLAGELRERLLEECDYAREAAHQQQFGALLAAMPGASAPAVIAERSTRRVLTTALVSHPALPAFAQGAPKAARDRAGQIIFRACFELLWRRAIYNADPHPGNYLVAPDGAVTFLDFGCVRRFDAEMIRTWKELARAVLDDDRAAFPERFRALGFIGKDRGFDWDYQWDAMRFMYRPFLTPGFTFDGEFVGKTFGVMMFDNPNKTKLAMPPAWLFLNRLQWGLFAVLAQLGATGAWGDILRALLAADVEPAPALSPYTA